jgi:hypothetical protein
MAAVESVNLSQGATLTTHTTNITSLQSSVSTLNSTTSTHSSQIATLQSSDSTQNSTLSTHTTQIAALETSMGSYPAPQGTTASVTIVSADIGDFANLNASITLYKIGKHVSIDLRTDGLVTSCPSDEYLVCAGAIPVGYRPNYTIGLYGIIQLFTPGPGPTENHQCYMEVDTSGNLTIYRVAAGPYGPIVKGKFDSAVWGLVNNPVVVGNWITA